MTAGRVFIYMPVDRRRSKGSIEFWTWSRSAHILRTEYRTLRRFGIPAYEARGIVCRLLLVPSE